MNKRYMVAAVLALTLIFCLSVTGAYAFDHDKSKGGYYSKEKGHHGGLEDKVTRKAHFILKNKEELGLSDEQVKKIKDLKIAIKKDLIGKKAEIEIIALDIKAKMWEEKIDTAEIDKLIDKKYDLKKEKAKSVVAAYAALKNTLTEGQKEKLKGLYKKCKEGKSKGR